MKKPAKKICLTVASTCVVAASFAAGRLIAQPAPAAKPKNPLTPEQQAFQGDLNAAINANHFSKVNNLLSQAAGAPELTTVVVEKAWNQAFNAEPNGDRRAVMQESFAAHQRQLQIELMEQILIELKKQNAKK
ncbi:MAG TPA: hypothetical protein VGB77_09525 [Abditibacteriaceae bacterium]|jgi:hypothetical protein